MPFSFSGINWMAVAVAAILAFLVGGRLRAGLPRVDGLDLGRLAVVASSDK